MKAVCIIRAFARPAVCTAAARYLGACMTHLKIFSNSGTPMVPSVHNSTHSIGSTTIGSPVVSFAWVAAITGAAAATATVAGTGQFATSAVGVTELGADAKAVPGGGSVTAAGACTAAEAGGAGAGASVAATAVAALSTVGGGASACVGWWATNGCAV